MGPCIYEDTWFYDQFSLTLFVHYLTLIWQNFWPKRLWLWGHPFSSRKSDRTKLHIYEGVRGPFWVLIPSLRYRFLNDTFFDTNFIISVLTKNITGQIVSFTFQLWYFSIPSSFLAEKKNKQRIISSVKKHLQTSDKSMSNAHCYILRTFFPLLADGVYSEEKINTTVNVRWAV